MVFQDSDVAKWIEAASYLLAAQPDLELERIVDRVIETIAKAQQADGYLNTYFTLKEPGARWTNLAECHELYCAGHMIEAGVAYYEATGKRNLLDVVTRLADHIGTVFGTEPGQLPGYDGHQEVELALFKLYQITGEESYLNLSRYFLEQRGAVHTILWRSGRSGSVRCILESWIWFTVMPTLSLTFRFERRIQPKVMRFAWCICVLQWQT